MKQSLIIVCICLSLFSCNKIKNKTKDGLKSGGEIVGKSVSEFSKGVKEGVDESFSKQVVLSDSLVAEGIEMGKILYRNSIEGTDDILSIYFIFNQDVDISILAKVKDKDMNEMGRCFLDINTSKDSAAYYDFVFDSRININYDCIIELEKYEKNI